ncbi:MAG: MmcQ/YjbR family DNA-binding protein [Phycisphaeraceae bacterium]|nr:MmcQ/YjbR family DNA-binding protein [Phycisphaeraceae bacterium]
MTEESYRRLLLSMPGAQEREHMGHPDFRVGGRIFATIFEREDRSWGMLKLTPEQQERACDDSPAVFEPIPGAWGTRGCTRVDLRAARVAALRPFVELAWRNTAPRALLKQHDHSERAVP